MAENTTAPSATGAVDSRLPLAGYRGLPMLAGIAPLSEASRPGLGIEACVDRLKRYHYAMKRMVEALCLRITSEPIYELKMGFSYHAHVLAEHVTAMRGRVAEMREPPLGLEKIPHPALKLLFDELDAAPTTERFVRGMYGVALAALKDGLERHVRETNPLADHPSVRVCRFALLEIGDLLAWGAQAMPSLAGEPEADVAPWLGLLEQCLAAAGGLDGAGAEEGRPATPAPMASRTPRVFDPVPKRDERFVDSYNAGVNPEVFLYTPEFPAHAKTLMLLYKRIREIDVPEVMATILVESRDKPWEFHRMMVRQLWDEARHAMMGEVGFLALGVDWRKIPINFTWALNLNTQLSAVERHAVLYFIEQGLMDRTGKRYEWEVSVDSGNPLLTTFQDYDWADEVLHASIGREWYVKQFATREEALGYGDRCWSRVLSQFGAFRERGLTEHRNWWPELYREACARWGIEPEPAVLAYATTYEETRPDLKKVSAPA